MTKRALVTGGAGSLGSTLCARLLERGDEVICVDDFSTGSRANVARLLDDRRFELLRHDVTRPLTVQVDEIYNLAAPPYPGQSPFDPVQTVKTSVLGAMNLLDLARTVRARILQASSSEVYGEPEGRPQREDDWGRVNPLGLRACFEEGKRCAETLFFDYHRQHGVEVKVARIFNAYGPGMSPDDGREVASFIVQALLGEPITVHGDGRQPRSLCFTADVVDGLLRLMRTPAPFTGPVNLGDPQEVTVRELAELVLELTGSASALVFTPQAYDGPGHLSPDVALARHALGWEPRASLRDGLARTIADLAAALERDPTGRRTRGARGALEPTP